MLSTISTPAIQHFPTRSPYEPSVTHASMVDLSLQIADLQFIVLTVSHVGRHRSGRLVWFWLLPYPPKHTLPFQLQVRSRPGCVTRSARAFRFVMHIACCRIFVLHYTVAFRCSLPVLYEHVSLSLSLSLFSSSSSYFGCFSDCYII